MKYQHLRHATGILHYGGIEILLDPMFAPKEVNPPIQNSWNDLRNPRVEFPLDLACFQPPEYCLVTHLHPDHFDDYALKHLPNNIYLICQAENSSAFKDMGFTNVIPIEKELTIGGITLIRVPGQHGTGKIAELMGISPGYVLKAANEPTLYITGDTIFYDEVKRTLDEYKPDLIITFGGTAQFAQGDPITLSPEDILKIHKTSPQAQIICVHMDAINHCRTTKSDLKKLLSTELDSSQYPKSFFIPDNGETVEVK